MWAQTPTISPLNPAVNQGATQTFTVTANPGTGGTWTCTSCAGSINSSTGVYTAPSSVTAQQSLGGYQLLPNNHIFNTDISALSVNGSNTTWVNTARATNHVHYLPSFPTNYTNGSTPTQAMTFKYTTGNNGLAFQIPTLPDVLIEEGWYSDLAQASPFPDHHLRVADYTTGVMEDMYQYYAAGVNGTCALCTSQSGVIYGFSDYPLPANGATDAASLFLSPLILKIQEMEAAVATGGTINHALRNTFAQGYEASSYIWPAMAMATDGGVVPFGARSRLKSSYSLAGLSPIATILATQLQHYGLINADGGSNWESDTEYGPWPAAYLSAFSEIQSAGKNFTVTNTSINGSNVATVIAANDFVAGSTQTNISGTTNCSGALNGNNILVTAASGTQFSFALTHATCAGGADTGLAFSPLTNYMEFVDESGLEITSTSGETTNNRETVTYTASTGTIGTDVALQGVTVNMLHDVQNIMAGTPAYQLASVVKGSSNTSLTWTLGPNVETLSASANLTGIMLMKALTFKAISSVTHVNSTDSGLLGAATGSTPATNAITVSTGNLLVCAARTSNGSIVSSVTDTSSTNTFHSTTQQTGASTNTLDVWYAYNTVAKAGDVITFHYNQAIGVSAEVWCDQYAGIQTSSDPLDNTGGNQTGSGSVLTSTPTVIPAIAHELLFAAFMGSSSPTGTWTAGLCGGLSCALDNITNSAGANGIAAMSESVEVPTFQTTGSIGSSTGIYTAPSTLALETEIAVTATSVANSAVVGIMTLDVWPNTGIYTLPSIGADYTDSHGHVWKAGPGLGMVNQPRSLGCCNTQNETNYTGSATDKYLWWDAFVGSTVLNDDHWDFLVPQGTYLVTFNTMGWNAPGTQFNNFLSQGNLLASNVDFSASVGQYAPYIYTTKITVGSDNILKFGEFVTGGTPGQTVSSLSITASTPNVPAAPTKKGVLLMANKGKQ
jgi:hypothetical protein